MNQKPITLQIDNHSITVPDGTTILDAATEIGISIPTLCHIKLKGTCVDNHPASVASVWLKWMADATSYHHAIGAFRGT
jgi:Na+/serine symporter